MLEERVSPLAGAAAPLELLVNVPLLVTAYYVEVPDPSVAGERVAFGTSGHRGSSTARTFNERHILVITQAICSYRRARHIDGPLFLGIDTHALSVPAFTTALEVLAANGVDVMIAPDGQYTPTPAVSHAILTYNLGRTSGLADGIVVTPSHNPPDDGGFKYNPPHGGPAEPEVTAWIEKRANELLRARRPTIRRMPYSRALGVSTTHRHDYVASYVNDLSAVLDLDAMRDARIHVGVDPMGGAGVQFWHAIADRYRLNVSVVSDVVDPTFRFMTVDWDGKIRMDPSSPYAMRRLLALKDRFDVACACDPDHDRHGIVVPSAGLLPPNHYLAAAVEYLFTHRPAWKSDVRVGKTVVTSAILDRVASRLGRPLYDVPVGFKWFVNGLLDGSVGFAGEESAGASFLRRDGTVWTTDKDGIVAALLSAEMTVRTGRDPGVLYRDLTAELGDPAYRRLDMPATAGEKNRLARLDPSQLGITQLAGEPVQAMLTRAAGNGAPIGGLKVVAAHGWFAVRPSGTENILKMYAESFRGDEHLGQIIEEAESTLSVALGNTGS
ncbi:MAG TPA: phosphoglucomutase (alpha-D-glucose-1,6-bisphosphate-dependent) [Gemmatimonadaceae bacterium]